MMKNLAILLLTLSLALTLGCDDDDVEAVDEEPAQVEDQADEADDQDAPPEEAMHDDEESAAEEQAARAQDGAITVRATANSFEPSAIEAPAGEELAISFIREVDTGCMTEVVFPDHDIEEELPSGETVTVTLTPEEGEVIRFECGMGMGESTITAS